jgi:hypothetical protein
MFTAIQTYLGEKVVSEKEYLSAILGLLLPSFLLWNQASYVLFDEFFGNKRGFVEQAVRECLVMMWSLSLE